MAINNEIDSFIKRIIPPVKKELKLIREHDWRKDKSLKSRETTYKMHKIFTKRAIDNMKALYNMAEKQDAVGMPKVKNALKLLREFYTIVDERYTDYVSDTEWMLPRDGEDQKAMLVRQENEVKFQSMMLDDIMAYEIILRDINDGEESKEFILELHKNTPFFPLMMVETVVHKYPEVQEVLESKED